MTEYEFELVKVKAVFKTEEVVEMYLKMINLYWEYVQECRL